jgi:hypothetical protein
MLILCVLTIIGVLFQAGIFLKLGISRSKSIGITNKEIKETIVNSSIFSIIPSLPILISYLILVPALGKFLPWVRLSVIGSAAYETMAADMAVKSFGYNSLSDPFTPEVYLAIAWTVTGAILLSAATTFLLKPYDKRMKSIEKSGNKFIPIMITAMFLGLLSNMIAPYLVNFKDITGMLTIIVSGIAVILFNKIGKKIKIFKDFAFAGSMVSGMIFASIFTLIFA